MSKIKLIVLFVFVAFTGFTQDVVSEKSSEFKIDTTFIEDISDKFILKLIRDTRIDSYSINVNDGTRFGLKPNVSANYSASLDYRFIAFFVGLPKKWLNNDEMNRLKGETTNFNISFSFFFNKWIQSVRYNYTKGYYIENTGDLEFIEDWRPNIDPYLQLPDLKVQSFGGTTSYVFNADKFSFRAFSQQTQIQKKSAGSFIPSFQYDYFSISNISGNESRGTLSLAVIAGYQYNLVFLKNFNLSGGVFPGFGFEYATNPIEKPWNPKLIANLNLNLNYQYQNFFCGLQFSSSNSSLKEVDAVTNNTISYGSIYLGYRFNAPKIIEKPTNWIEKKIF